MLMTMTTLFLIFPETIIQKRDEIKKQYDLRLQQKDAEIEALCKRLGDIQVINVNFYHSKCYNVIIMINYYMKCRILMILHLSLFLCPILTFLLRSDE